jgi:hypothetical protein
VDANGTATLTATAAAGYRFVNWSGSIATSTNPTFVPMSYAQTITANFVPVTNTLPGNWSVRQIVTGGATGWSLNSFGQVAGQSNGFPFLWTPAAANSAAGSLMNLSSSTNLQAAVAVNDHGQVLFSQVNSIVFGGTYGVRPIGQSSLWTPTVAQGTTGTTTTISTESGLVLNSLNNFGQVGAFINGSPAIWTPATPNGAAGTSTANTQWQGLSAMNGFGQAIVNLQSQLLFTPLTRNGSVGTFTSISGLAGSTQNVLVAINEAGTVLGYSCVTQASGGCQNQGFLWTSSTPNGISGTTVAMPVPSGYPAVTPIAINATGGVVGTMAPSTGSAIPFLYLSGTYYDLTTLSGMPATAIPSAINQAGQILINDSISPYYGNSVYLATPSSKLFTGDFDGDGHKDLIWQADTTGQVTVNYFAGAGGTVFQGWNWLNSGGIPGWRVVAAADFDGNGVPDLVWMNNQTRQVTIHYYGGAGGATFLGWNWLNSGGIPGWTVVGAVDFDGNGTPDLIWQNDATRQVTVHYFGGPGGATIQGWNWLNSGGVPGWAVVGAADFDGNGVPDLVWQSASTRQVTVHYFGGAQGATFTGWQYLNSGGIPGWRVVIPH